jgi:hypothetical protein
MWPLIGRAEELAFVADVLGRSAAPGVIVSGGAGVGKTRLVGEALAAAEQRGFVTRWAIASRSARSIPFGALSHWLPAPEGAPASSLDLMCQLELRLVQEAGEGAAEARQGGLVLGIDDAHLLDDLSASLVQRLVARGSARVRSTAPRER